MIRLLTVAILAGVFLWVVGPSAAMASPLASGLSGLGEERDHPARCFGEGEEPGLDETPTVDKQERQSIRAALVYVGGAAIVILLLTWRTVRWRRRRRAARVEQDTRKE